MKIFIDIGHPAHVHYFKNFIKIMESRGHSFLVSSREKECTFDLLDFYNIKYKSRGKGGQGLLGKLLYIPKADLKLFQLAKKFKPDLFLSFASPYAAQVSKLLNKPHIAFDDTEHAKFGHIMYKPFTDVIYTPVCFTKEMGKNQIKFNGYIELCALHPNYFTPNPNILKTLNLNENEKFVVLRFVSWEASHDIGHSGISLEVKRELIKKLASQYKVFISSESNLPEEFEKYRISINPEDMHNVLAFAEMFIGEGATMAAESAMLGTPAIYVNTLNMGYITELAEKYSLIISLNSDDGILDKAEQLITTSNLKNEFQKRRQKMLSEKIDVTALMVWFVENYPESKKVIQINPDYQNNFI